MIRNAYLGHIAYTYSKTSKIRSSIFRDTRKFEIHVNLGHAEPILGSVVHGRVSDAFLLFCHFPRWYLGLGVVLDCVDPDLCLLPYYS